MSIAWNGLAEIGQALASGRNRPELHRRLVEIIRAAANCDAVALTRVNPVSGAHETLCNIGYSPSVLHHLNTWFVAHDEVFRYMRTRDSQPLRWKDMRSLRDHVLSGAGIYAGGLSGGRHRLSLQRGGGLYRFLHVGSTVRDYPSDDTMRLLGACQTIVGCASDWWQEVDAEDVQGLRVALTGPRHYRVLSNRDDELRALFESRVVRLLPLSLADVPALSFLVRGQSSVAIRARHLLGMVVLDIRREPVPHHLTARELDVSSALVRGMTNGEIARRIGISIKTVSHHVENVIHKLDGRNRTKAAVVAARLGLRSLNDTRRLAE